MLRLEIGRLPAGDSWNKSDATIHTERISMDPGSAVETRLALILIPMFFQTAWGNGENKSPDTAFRKEEHLGFRFAWGAISVGVVLRLWQYLFESLWLDEALLA